MLNRQNFASDCEYNISMEPELTKDSDGKTVTVIVTGFPQKTCTKDVEGFMQNVCAGNKYDVKVDSKNYFRGFVYVKFLFLEEAESFINQEYVFQKKLLNCRISMQYYQFINESIDNLRNPKKVFVDRIPKHWSKKEVEKFFDMYGEVDYLSLVDKDHKTVNFAYVTFVQSESASNCVQSKLIKLKDKRKIKVEYSNPKFSANMLNKIHPILRRYIEGVQNGSKIYDPKDFIYLQDIVLANENLFIEQNVVDPRLCYNKPHIKRENCPQKNQLELKNEVSSTLNDQFADLYTEQLAFDMSKLNLYNNVNTKNTCTDEPYDPQENHFEFCRIDEQIKNEYGQPETKKADSFSKRVIKSDHMIYLNKAGKYHQNDSPINRDVPEPYYVIEKSNYEDNSTKMSTNCQPFESGVECNNPSDIQAQSDYYSNEYDLDYNNQHNYYYQQDYVNKASCNSNGYRNEEYTHPEQFYNQYDQNVSYQTDYVNNYDSGY